MLIQGSVTDQSPGQTCLGIPAVGTPAISDSSTSQWMEYLYMQEPMPQNATGVSVELAGTSSTGQTISIGTVTSDINGQYKTTWTPPTNDLYTITATFAGSNSYFGSSAETSLASRSNFVANIDSWRSLRVNRTIQQYDWHVHNRRVSSHNYRNWYSRSTHPKKTSIREKINTIFHFFVPKTPQSKTWAEWALVKLTNVRWDSVS